MEVVPPASGEGSAELVLDKGTVVDHLSLTSPMCGDLLKYVLPVLSETTDVSGQFSVTWTAGGCRWTIRPGNRFRTVQHSSHGRFQLDAATPLAVAPHPGHVRVAEESVVQFSMVGRRSRTRADLRTPQVTLRTQGSVDWISRWTCWPKSPYTRSSTARRSSRRC